MKISFFVNIDENQKTGLFNSVHKRIKNIKNQGQEVEVLIYYKYDSFLLQILKKIFKKNINKKRETFIYDTVKYNYLNNKKILLEFFLEKFFLEKFFLEKFFLNESKKLLDLFKNTDIIVCHWGVTTGIIGSYIGEKLNKKVFIVHHGSDIHTIPKKNQNLRKILIDRMEKISGNIFVSNQLKIEALNLGFSGNNSYISYNGVDYIKNIKKQEDNKNKKVIGYVGNLYWIKNADSLPELFFKINQFDKNIRFIIVGDGEYKKIIEKKINQLGIDVEFVGKVDPNKVFKYMELMDLLIIPSRNEGMPLVALEAKSIGLKVIGSDVGGIKEAIGDKNVVEFDEQFIENFSKLATIKLNDKSEESLEKDFLWKNISKEELKIYLGNKSSSK